MLFGSDNWAGAAPEIVDALTRASQGLAPSYGADAFTRSAERQFCEIFEREVTVFFVATGGAANGLALSVLTPSYGMIYCHEESHVQMDECAGPELFTGGAKLLPLRGAGAKIAPEMLQKAIAGYPARPAHGAPAKALSITQATECGTLYSVEELKALCDVAQAHGLSVHMDGARFANALVSLGCTPAEMTWKAGVDVLSFGGTKNGCFAAEAVVFFNPDMVGDFIYKRKRSGHLLSKLRFISAQFEAYFSEGRWLGYASRANAMAARLSEGLAKIDGVKIWYPTQANEVFVEFPAKLETALREAGAVFFPWVTPGDPSGGRMSRLIASFATTESDIDKFLSLANELAKSAR